MPTIEASVVGLKHHDFAKVGGGIEAGSALLLHRQPDNPHDGNAIAVSITVGGRTRQIGYIDRHSAKELAPLLDGGTPVRAIVKALPAGRAQSFAAAIEFQPTPRPTTKRHRPASDRINIWL